MKLAARFARLYPKSTYLDSFQYSEALANFHLGQYDRAVEVAETIARADLQGRRGADQPSPNKWQALYILGQIFDARRAARQGARILSAGRRPVHRRIQRHRILHAQGTESPRGVGRSSADQAGCGPGRRCRATECSGDPAGLRAVGVQPPVANPAGGQEPLAKPGIKLEYRNIAKADVTVYPVDLMQLYLTRRNLNGIAGIDLAGITPLVEKSVALGDGSDYDDQFPADRPAAGQGGCVPGHDPGR